MKRRFADLHLIVDVNNNERLQCMISKASELGYGLVAVPLPPDISLGVVTDLRKACEGLGMDFASRIDLAPHTAEGLLRDLRRFRRRCEVLSVACENKQVARQAAKDHRVDLLSFPRFDYRGRFFDDAEAELASNSSASLEIDAKALFTLSGLERTRFVSNLRREVSISREFHVPVVFSSGVADELLLRKPMELAAVASLFNLDEACALQTVSENPEGIVQRNRKKLSPEFVAPGVHLLKRGRLSEAD